MGLVSTGLPTGNSYEADGEESANNRGPEAFFFGQTLDKLNIVWRRHIRAEEREHVFKVVFRRIL